jgi:hypothetical protein
VVNSSGLFRGSDSQHVIFVIDLRFGDIYFTRDGGGDDSGAVFFEFFDAGAGFGDEGVDFGGLLV